MEFENPLALWGLLGLSLPIIIHLVSLQKAKKIYFSSTQLLRQLTVESSAKRKLKEWLILASRLLALMALVFAFAMPFISGNSQWNSNQEGLTFQLYFDNSYSMERNPGQGTLFDQSLGSVQTLVNANSVSTRYQFLDNDFKSNDMVSRSSELLNKRLTQEQFSFRARSLGAVIARFKDANQLANKNKHCFIFSDFQKSTLGNIKQQYDSTASYYMVPVQNMSIGNIYIDSVWFDRPVVKKGDKLKVFFKAYNTGNEEVKEQLFKLVINQTQAAISYLDIPANTAKEGTFEYIVSESGDLKAKISFDDGDLSFDNTFYFTLNASNAIRVVSIADVPNTPQALVFKNAEDFVINTQLSNALNYAQLDEADFIIIEGFKEQPKSLFQRIGVWLNAGKSIFLVPSVQDRSMPIELSNALTLPVINFKTVDSTNKPEAFQLAFPDLNNPFFSDIFEDKSTHMVMPYAQPSFTLPPGFVNLLSTSNGYTAVSRSSKGSNYKGTAYLCHFPLNSNQTNLSQHSFFVPLLLKMALFSKENTENTYFRQGVDVVEISIKEEVKAGLVEIRNIKGELVIPSQRLNGNRLSFELPEQVNSPGFYDLVYNHNVLRTFALNAGKEESLTACYSSEELTEVLKTYPNVKVLKNVSEITMEDQLKELTKGVPLWKYCLFLSLVFFLIEIVLIRWFN